MTDECITIESSEEDDIQIMDPPVVNAKPELAKETKRKVPLQSIDTGKSVFTTLLNTCKTADPSSEMDIIVNKMWKRFHQAESSYTSSAEFIEFVKTLITKASKEPFCQLKSVSDDLKFHTIKAKSSAVESVVPGLSTSSNQDESNPKSRRIINKLEKVILKLQKKIDHLENQEVDLNDSSDEENSAYIQVSRYKKRMCDVYKKICELRKTDSFNDCLLGNIKFSGTKISTLNRAIEKFYNEEREFPDFRQVLTIVEKANSLKNLNLSPQQCHETAVQAFKELGETLKRKRQFEFHDSLTSYLKSNETDPATENQLLEEKLQENKKLYGNRIDEIIDEFAKKQAEAKLEPEDVPDDLVDEAAADDEEVEEEDDVSSVGEMESNADDSSADEDSERENNTDEDSDQKEPSEMRDFNIVIPSLHQIPEWVAYQKTERARHSALGCADTVCQPVPGCSKDLVDDFCAPCASKTPPTSATKRIHANRDDDTESSSKVAKIVRPLISVDLTDDSQSTESATPVVKSLSSSSGLNSKDPLGSEKASGSQMSNGITDESTESSASRCESPKPQQFVVVDVESILARKNAKFPKLMRNKVQNGGKIVEKPLSVKTDSEVNHKDAVDENVSVTDPGVEDRLKKLNKNGLKIIHVTSKSSENSIPLADEKNEVSTNHAKDGVKEKTQTDSNGSNVKKNCEIIDLEEAARQDQTVSKTVAELVRSLSTEPNNTRSLFSKTVPSTQNKKPSFFPSKSYQETKKPEGSRPPWQKPNSTSNQFPATSTPKPSSTYQPRSSPINETVSQETRKPAVNRPPWQNCGPDSFPFQATSTPKPSSSYQPRPSSSGFQTLSSTRSNFPRSYPGSQRHPHSQPHLFGGRSYMPNRNMRGPPSAHQRMVYTGPRSATAKRTVQTTQSFVKGNSIFMQTTTVVQEVQMPAVNSGMMRGAFTSNGPVGRGGSSNRAFAGASGSGNATQSRCSSANPNGGVSQDPRRQTKRKNSADVITLE